MFHLMTFIEHRKYARQAKRHNEQARQLRLQKTDYKGYPLPTGKDGVIKLTQKFIVEQLNFVSTYELEKQYRDRALDLRVDLEWHYDPHSQAIFVHWHPHKGRWPKERY